MKCPSGEVSTLAVAGGDGRDEDQREGEGKCRWRRKIRDCLTRKMDGGKRVAGKTQRLRNEFRVVGVSRGREVETERGT